MSAPRKAPPPAVIEAQHKASDPAVSAWVSANAGSGKTHVLTERVIRLLLTGTAPEKILCITFTKAAAANMATRVFDTLSEWIALDDAGARRSGSRALGIDAVSDRSARCARRLFAVAIETPGGLKVQTIHAFCTRLLHQFPFEAGVAARFKVLDEATETQLLEKLTLDVMLEGAANPGSALGHALADRDHGRRRPDLARRDPHCGRQARHDQRLDRPRGLARRARSPNCRRRSAYHRDETIETCRSGILRGRAHPRRTNGTVSRRSSRKARRTTGTRLSASRRCATPPGAQRLDLLLSIHCTKDTCAAQDYRHQRRSATLIRSWHGRLLDEQAPHLRAA